MLDFDRRYIFFYKEDTPSLAMHMAPSTLRIMNEVLGAAQATKRYHNVEMVVSDFRVFLLVNTNN